MLAQAAPPFSWEAAIIQGGSFALLAWLIYWWTTKYQPAQHKLQMGRDARMVRDFLDALKAQQSTFTEALSEMDQRHREDHAELRTAIAELARATTQRMRAPE